MSERAPTRLFHPGPVHAGARVQLDEHPSHQAGRVLRLTAGAALELFNGSGLRWPATLLEARANGAAVQLGDPINARTESPLDLHLAQCLPGGDKMDWVVEKAVEMGVRSVQPLQARRSVLRLDTARATKRLAHWQRIAIAACMQCGRDTVPEIHPIIDLERWLQTSSPQGGADPVARRWLLSPSSTGEAPSVGPTPKIVWLLVGPEGGLAEEETARALAAGWEPLQLGPRVLRTETAGLAALAAVQTRFGDFTGLR
jgi:16S rRNA (uracil1498-N3)-methyltransferase